MDAREVTKDLKQSRYCDESEDLGIGVGIRMESDFSHGVRNLAIFHEGFPHRTAAEVFCHQHANSHVDSNHVFAIPSSFWLESIGETIASPKLIAISFPHR